MCTLACLHLNYIGFEIDKEYYDIDINRLEDKNIDDIKSNVEQLRLF